MRNLLLVGLLLLSACISRPAPDPAVMRDQPPPWAAPRDAVSYIDAAGLEQRPLGEDSDPWVVKVRVIVSGNQVTIPAMIGIDRLRAIQAVLHTHDETGDVWLEGPDTDRVSLSDLFELWGVRFDEHCLGANCTNLRVLADGKQPADPIRLRLREHQVVEVRVD